MSFFKLICEDEAVPFVGASKLKHEFESDDLFVILNNMTSFLQKSGYLAQNQKLELGRDIQFDEDLDEYTETVFNTGAISGTIVTGTPIPKE